MKTRISLIVIFIATMGLSSVVRSDDTPVVKTILTPAETATTDLTSCRYEAEFHATGSLAADKPVLQGKVHAKKPGKGILRTLFGDNGIPPMRIKGNGKLPNDAKPSPFEVATNGKSITLIDETEKTYYVTTISEGMNQLNIAMNLLMREYLHPTPFSDEINAKSAKLEGEKAIGGVDCYVVFVHYYQNDQKARWYFGKKDYLPRCVERILSGDESEDKTVLTVSNLEVDPKLSDDTFTPKPEGYKLQELSEPSDPSLLSVGTRAPNWRLKTPDGATVSLRSLRGNVVIMDFWATWCGPCKMAMPGVQKLHEKFKDKPVRVFGVDCMERNKDAAPEKYMKEKKYTYGLLLDGTEVAQKYQVAGIPTFYIIGQNGKVAYATSGFDPDNEEKFAKIVNKLRKDDKASKPTEKDKDDE